MKKTKLVYFPGYQGTMPLGYDHGW